MNDAESLLAVAAIQAWAVTMPDTAELEALRAKVHALEAIKAPLVAQVAAFDPIRAELLDIVQKYAAQSMSSDGGGTPGGLEHMGDVWKLLTRWGTALARTPPAQAIEAITAPYEARIAELNSVVKNVWEVIEGSDGLAGWHKNGDVADWKEFDIYREVQEALAHTPTDSLEAYRRKVLNEAVEAVRKQSEFYSEFQNENAVLMAAAEVIRRMEKEAKDAS